MALVAGQLAFLAPTLAAWLPGKDDGMHLTEVQHFDEGGFNPPSFPFPFTGDVGDGGAPGLDDSGEAVAGQIVVSGFNTGMDWFEKVHVFPDSNVNNPRREEGFEIEFGNIVSDTEREYEFYSAFRRLPNTLTAVTISPLLGVEFPDLTIPTQLDPQTSLLHPSSTFNTGLTSGLGTLVRLKVRALRQGAASFDLDVPFTFSNSGDAFLPISGNRIVLFDFDQEGDFLEVLEFLTNVKNKINEDEQRSSPRHFPRQFIECTYQLDGHERRRLEAMLFDWQPNQFAVTVKWDQMKVATAVTGGVSPTITVDSTNFVDLRIGGLAAVITDSDNFDVLEVASKTASTITFVSNVLGSYAVGAKVYPVRLCHLPQDLAGSRKIVNLQRLNLRFRVIDNNTGALTGDTSPYSTYSSKVLLDDCNFVDGDEVGIGRTRDIDVIDNATGLVMQFSEWEHGKRLGTKGFITKTRADLMEVRRLMIALKGRLTSFYIPTFQEDLEVVATLSSGAATMDIRRIGYTRHIQGRAPWDKLRIHFTDGTTLDRTVSSYTEVSLTVERLTLNTTWPSTRLASEVERVELIQLVRIDTDRIEIRHSPTIGYARTFFPVREVTA